MSIKVSIKNDEPEGTPGALALTVVTVTDDGEQEQRLSLAAQQSVSLEVAPSQFVMVEEQ